MNNIFKLSDKWKIEVYSLSWDRIFLPKKIEKSLDLYTNEIGNLENEFLQYLKWKESFDEWDIWFFIWDKMDLDSSDF